MRQMAHALESLKTRLAALKYSFVEAWLSRQSKRDRVAQRPSADEKWSERHLNQVCASVSSPLSAMQYTAQQRAYTTAIVAVRRVNTPSLANV